MSDTAVETTPTPVPTQEEQPTTTATQSHETTAAPNVESKETVETPAETSSKKEDEHSEKKETPEVELVKSTSSGANPSTPQKESKEDEKKRLREEKEKKKAEEKKKKEEKKQQEKDKKAKRNTLRKEDLEKASKQIKEDEKANETAPAEGTAHEKEEEDSSSSEDEEHNNNKKLGRTPSKSNATHEAEKKPRKKGETEGFLFKKGDIGPIKNWKRRHFRLHSEPEENKLAYYQNENEATETGSIDLNTVTGLEANPKKPFSFQVKTSTRVYFLKAETKADLDLWTGVLQKYVKEPAPAPEKEKTAEQHEGETSHEGGSAELARVASGEATTGATATTSAQDAPKAVSGEESEGTTVTAPAPVEEEVKVPQRQLVEGDLSLSIYSSGRTLVSEVRKVHLDEHKSVVVTNLPRTLVARSVQFRSLTDPSATVLEQSFSYDEHTEKNVLSKLVGKSVAVERSDNHQVAKGTVTHRLDNNDLLVQNENSTDLSVVRTTAAPLHINVNGDNGVKLQEPSLHWVLDTTQDEHLVEITYQIDSGVSWDVEYNAIVDSKEKSMELNGWYTFSNVTGKRFQNAEIALIRDLHVSDEDLHANLDRKDSENFVSKMVNTSFARKNKRSVSVSLHSQSKHEKYPLGNKATLEENKQKQVKVVASKFPVKTVNMIRTGVSFNGEFQSADKFGVSSTNFDAERVITFVNSKENSLGLPLASGTLSVLRREPDGFGVEEVTETLLRGVTPGKTAFVSLEKLHGVYATRKQTAFHFEKNDKKSKPFVTETFEILIQNDTSVTVDVVLVESLYRWKVWEISNPSAPFNKDENDYNSVNWVVQLKGKTKKRVQYTVTYKDLPENY